jgi:hypothetical protein
VELASEIEELKIGLEEACEAILEGYRESLEAGGKAIILDREHNWLKQVYGQNEKSVEKFWSKFDQLPDRITKFWLKRELHWKQLSRQKVWIIELNVVRLV